MSDTQPSTLSAGIARADITPPVGIRSSGFASRGPLTRHHDPLLATALVLADTAPGTLALLTCDLIGLDADTVAEVRAVVTARTGIPGEQVMISCTHTHYGPDAFRAHDDPLVQAYRANLIHVLAGLVEEAAHNPRPAQLGVGWGQSDIGVNRREKLPDGRVILGQNPGGPVDRAVGVLRIDSIDGKPLACLVNFQTHPVSQGSQTDHISADYPGRMREMVEQITGVPCLFLQGACGDVNALIMAPGYEPARTLGTRLGGEVVRIWETIAPAPMAGLATASTTVALPGIRYGSPEAAAARAQNLAVELERLRGEAAAEGMIAWCERRLERARQAVQSWQGGAAMPAIQAEVQAWCVGERLRRPGDLESGANLAVVGAPGEIFTEIGQRVKSGSPFAHTFFGALTNGYIGYVPMPAAYVDGGYEVEHASQVDPDAAEILGTACLSLLARLQEVGS